MEKEYASVSSGVRRTKGQLVIGCPVLNLEGHANLLR